MLFIFDKVDVRMGRENHNVDNYIIGTKLKEFRQQAGLSLAKVAESVGVTPAFISMVENGKCGISFQKVHALVKLYGKTLADVTSTHPLADEKVINLNAASEVAFDTILLSWVDFACFMSPAHSIPSITTREWNMSLCWMEHLTSIFAQRRMARRRCVICTRATQQPTLPRCITASKMWVKPAVRSLFWKSQEAKIKEKKTVYSVL